MKNILTSLTLLAAATALTACFSDPTGPSTKPTEQEHKKPGQLQLVAMKGLGKAAVSSSDPDLFYLDTAKASFQQYFILQNTGDEPITDIDLTTDNPNFTFSPSHIAVLAPSSGASLVQVIKLNVVHGKRLDAIGYGDFLAAGPLVVNAVLSGTTIDSGDTVEAEAEATLSTFAKVARFTVGNGDSAASLTDMWHGWTANDRGQFNHYYVNFDSATSGTDPIELKNTGNAPLFIRRSEPDGSTVLDSVILAPGSTYTFSEGFMEIDSKGVTFAPADMPTDVTGKIQVIIFRDL